MPARRTSSTTPAIRIRRARAADLAALVDLENASFQTDRMSARQLRHHIDNASAIVLVAARREEIVGSAVVFLHPRHRSARLYSIAVSEDARGAGIGKQLLAAAERIAKTGGRAALRLEVREENQSARALYERNGYVLRGIQRGYYEDGHDAVRYEKTLGRRGRFVPPLRR